MNENSEYNDIPPPTSEEELNFQREIDSRLS